MSCQHRKKKYFGFFWEKLRHDSFVSRFNDTEKNLQFFDFHLFRSKTSKLNLITLTLNRFSGQLSGPKEEN